MKKKEDGNFFSFTCDYSHEEGERGERGKEKRKAAMNETKRGKEKKAGDCLL